QVAAARGTEVQRQGSTHRDANGENARAAAFELVQPSVDALDPLLGSALLELLHGGAVPGQTRRKHRQPAASQEVAEGADVLWRAGKPVNEQAADVAALEVERTRARHNTHAASPIHDPVRAHRTPDGR